MDRKDRIIQVAVAVALLAIIGAVIASLRYSMRTKTPRPDGWSRCRACGYEWAIPNKEALRISAEYGPYLDCPKCGAKKSGMPQGTCPRCKKRYDDDPAKRTWICPHCKLDIVKWYLDHPL